ncbi:MAG: isochorismatase family protein [Candidatus Tokpelaia sp.]|uniref:isochorismatase family protein n=1 Tax=Candidatus Tokpelaia sp. TaxID=2233777 RepID=UPI001239A222|nr:isochorismatase family protein [Candidatus Tokpelaia sp.]KAA6204626.1 MAG: isochorismatase family protein [Candidatus Tokpelaia sp.]KAA6205546.1 MAG: isochorismatase family protein [Candidatus Tokpelaia sp.]KAA6405611.1 hydrolase [Candidatus Tokpelaia sp.]
MTTATEKLLTPDNCAFIFIDHQPQMGLGTASIDRQLLKNNVVAMAKTARLFKVPTILTAIETEGFSGYIWPELMDVLRQKPIERSNINSWEEPLFLEAVKKLGKKKLVMAALWTEACLSFPVLSALAEGYEVFINIDASGGVSRQVHNAAIRRMEQHGAQSTTSIQLLMELQRDWKRRETYQGVMDISCEHFGAYGMGIDYAATMVHHQPQRAKFPHEVK